MQRYDEALTDYNRAIELDPNDAWYYALRGRTHRDMGSMHDAELDVRRAHDIDATRDWADPDALRMADDA